LTGWPRNRFGHRLSPFNTVEPDADTLFTDGVVRPVYKDERGPVVIGAVGHRVRCVWYIPRDTVYLGDVGQVKVRARPSTRLRAVRRLPGQQHDDYRHGGNRDYRDDAPDQQQREQPHRRFSPQLTSPSH
jgi:hypothetical protein